MSDTYRVVCPDVVGRGESDALADPAGYQVPAYVADMVTLLARLNATTLHWVGTSMGGLIGLGLASLKASPVSRLVLNDVGPAIRFEAIQRIGAYLGAPMHWKTLDEAADYLWSISQGFGPHTREQWLALTRPMLRPDGEGFKPHYDANIAVPFKKLTQEMVAGGEAMTWLAYDAIRIPTLLLRGADSDLLTRETALAMTQRGPKAHLIEFAGVGHAPMLVAEDQVRAVREFLLS
jgi:pimeloyl-ACP methyl ester carboxylesterase